MKRTLALRLSLLLALVGGVTACGGAGAPDRLPPATLVPTRDLTSLPTNAPVSLRTPSPQPVAPATTPAAAPTPPPTATAESGIAQGVTPEGYHFLGRADAPVTVVTYSDFL